MVCCSIHSKIWGQSLDMLLVFHSNAHIVAQTSRETEAQLQMTRCDSSSVTGCYCNKSNSTLLMWQGAREFLSSSAWLDAMCRQPSWCDFSQTSTAHCSHSTNRHQIFSAIWWMNAVFVANGLSRSVKMTVMVTSYETKTSNAHSSVANVINGK